MGSWSPTTAPGRGRSRYGAIRSGLPAEARYLTWILPPGGTAEGRRAELVAKTTARTDGIILAWPRIRAMPRSRASGPLFQGATSGSTSKIIVLTASSAAQARRSSSRLERS